jgi:hypothetical protein
MEPSAWDGFLHWIGQAQLGTVPAWFGGASLLLAVLLFMRDRRRDDRALIDKVAIWPTVAYDQTLTALVDAAKRNDGTQVKLTAKNASDLPVDVHAAVVEVTSQWRVPTSPAGDAWAAKPGTKPPSLGSPPRSGEASPPHPLVQPPARVLPGGLAAPDHWPAEDAAL